VSRTQDIKLSDFPGKSMEVEDSNGTPFLEITLLRSRGLSRWAYMHLTKYAVVLGPAF
jgi:hypothetical protein